MNAFRTMSAVAALAISVAGCSNPPERGVISDADYHPAWVQVIPGTTTCAGNPMICTTTPTQFIPWPERWEIEITDTKGNSGWLDVSEDIYGRCKLRSVYPECTDPKIGDARQ
ncbi:hypothetical protein PBI_OAKER_62 [Mycobacterium phage Oaker]|uniref:hypothetical protein n=1 Tax=Mycobacterium phage Oaker TaxID=1445727 RepID=UPI0003E3470C|nr:hypothetical protein CH12_gp62 [Mycobacterium phage Oaker]AHG24453.1 hypothetical protein PBI_OAKER_62 [Mycobacterium phage Oaker]